MSRFRASVLLCAGLLFGCASRRAEEFPADPLSRADTLVADFSQAIAAYGYVPDSTSAVLWLPDSHQLYVHNPGMASLWLPPGATLNPFLAYMALERGLFAGDTLEVDPRSNPYFTKQRIALRTVLQPPSVEFFAQVARQIGVKRCAAQLVKLGYTSAHFVPQTEVFWQDGSLRVSAYDPVRALDSLLRSNTSSVQALARALVLDSLGGFRLYGKRGWPLSVARDSTHAVNVGWWIGWVRSGNRYAVLSLRTWTAGRVRGGWTKNFQQVAAEIFLRHNLWPAEEEEAQ